MLLRSLILLAILLVPARRAWATGKAVRGVDPAQAHAYVPDAQGLFRCLDGSGSVPFSQVNDNYCDCPGDGSDEPGTSACYYGKFYCPNRGHQPQLISASFVDDGVCDCCDGSDESVTVCKNTCLDKGAAERQAIRDRVDTMKRSLDKKHQMITSAKARRASWPTRSKTIDTDLASVDQQIAELEKARAAAASAVDADRKRIAAEQEALRQQQAAAAAEAAGEKAAADKGTPTADGTADAVPHEETDEERGRRIASQWTHDPEAAAAPAGELTDEDGDAHGEEGGLPDYDRHEEDYPGPTHGPDGQPTTVEPGRQQQAAKRPGSKSLWDEFKAWCAYQVQYWQEELESTQAFLKVLATFANQIKEMVNDVLEGGLRAHQEKRVQRQVAERRAQQEALEGKLMAELNSLPAPWRTGHQQEKGEGEAAAGGGDAATTQPSDQASSRKVPSGRVARSKGPPRVLNQKAQPRHGKAAPAAGQDTVDPSTLYTPLEEKVHELDRQLADIKRKHEDLKAEQLILQRYYNTSGAGYDFGPDDTFASLAGRCLADTGTRWTYEACFFDVAVQKEPHNPSNKVRLGNWKGFANDYTEAVFNNGDMCANAPARSLTVKLTCGEDERMWGGEEPSTCVYTVWMASPLACRQEHLQQELDRLNELERFEAEVRAEIEAAEKARAAGRSDHTEL